MKPGYIFYRNTLIKVLLLGVAGVAFLCGFFRGDREDEPALTYVYIGFVALIWVAAAVVLAKLMIQSRKEMQEEKHQIDSSRSDQTN